jgi:GTP cyclohydrolase I
MTTSILRGILRESPAARAEFFETIKGSRFAA